MGRNAKTWDDSDKSMFRKLCAIMCTKAEICSVMDVSEKTLDRLVNDAFTADVPHDGGVLTFSEAFEWFSASGRISLRRKQYELAMDGDKSMLVWLGKQYLGQSENRFAKAQQEQQEKEDKKPTATVVEFAIKDRERRAKAAGGR